MDTDAFHVASDDDHDEPRVLRKSGHCFAIFEVSDEGRNAARMLVDLLNRNPLAQED